MSKLLLLIQSAADVAALPAATEIITRSGYAGVWAVYSPAIMADEKEFSIRFDKEIAALQNAIDAAKGREDFDAAKSYKEQRDTKVLEKGAAVKDSWKSLDEDAKKAAANKIFAPLIAALNAAKMGGRVTEHTDHYEPSEWVGMLNSLKGVWFDLFTPGSFTVAWPTSLVAPAVKAAPVAPAESAPNRYTEVRGMSSEALRARATELGVAWEGKKHLQLAAEVVAAEKVMT